ncbi:hypothetical protein HY990_05445 [Candidatus Micrarchaeota archaeon]|nr:hypothetical protein [Candidatus Micrarchaeota archaeon]
MVRLRHPQRKSDLTTMGSEEKTRPALRSDMIVSRDPMIESLQTESSDSKRLVAVRTALLTINPFYDLGVVNGTRGNPLRDERSLKILSKASKVSVSDLKRLRAPVGALLDQRRFDVLYELVKSNPQIRLGQVSRELNIGPELTCYYLRKYQIRLGKPATSKHPGVPSSLPADRVHSKPDLCPATRKEDAHVPPSVVGASNDSPKESLLPAMSDSQILDAIRDALLTLNPFTDLRCADNERGRVSTAAFYDVVVRVSEVSFSDFTRLRAAAFELLDQRRSAMLSELVEANPQIRLHQLSSQLGINSDLVCYYLRKYQIEIERTAKPKPLCVPSSHEFPVVLTAAALTHAVCELRKNDLKFAGCIPSFWTFQILSRKLGVSENELRGFVSHEKIDLYKIASAS